MREERNGKGSQKPEETCRLDTPNTGGEGNALPGKADLYPHLILWVRDELPSLAKDGWTRHQVNGPVPLKGADGVVGSPPRPVPTCRESVPHRNREGAHSGFWLLAYGF